MYKGTYVKVSCEFKLLSPRFQILPFLVESDKMWPWTDNAGSLNIKGGMNLLFRKWWGEDRLFLKSFGLSSIVPNNCLTPFSYGSWQFKMGQTYCNLTAECNNQITPNWSIFFCFVLYFWLDRHLSFKVKFIKMSLRWAYLWVLEVI